MENLTFYVLLFFSINGVCVLSIKEDVKNSADTWNIQDQCGRELHSYGGVLHFDASRLRQTRCMVTIVGKGENDTMLSMYFTTFNVSEGCTANLTIKEPHVVPNPISPFDSKGLFLTFCKNSYYLNEYLMYTTDHNVVRLIFNAADNRVRSDMRFTLKFSSFTTRILGCAQKELDDGMFSCPSGRCVHTDVLCKDLNPCGDQRDCNVTSLPSQTDEGDRGLHYINFVVIFAVVVFAMFALIQVTLIIRNNQPMCYRKDRMVRIDDDEKVRIEAELMPMKGPRRGVDEYIMEENNARS